MISDAAALWRLARESRVLDENSPYAYLLVCSHFASTSMVAECDGEVVGFVSGYRPPSAPESVFVWQIAVDPRWRGQGVGLGLLLALLGRPATSDATHLEASVTPGNAASRRLFDSLSAVTGAPKETSVLFPPEVFPGGDHEPELLIRVGPLPSRSSDPPAGEAQSPAPTSERKHA